MLNSTFFKTEKKSSNWSQLSFKPYGKVHRTRLSPYTAKIGNFGITPFYNFFPLFFTLLLQGDLLAGRLES